MIVLFRVEKYSPNRSENSRPATTCCVGVRHLGNFVLKSNFTLVSELVQTRPATDFPESWQ